MAYSIDYIYNIRDRYSAILNKMAVAGTKFDTGVTRIQKKLTTLQNRFQTAGAKLTNLQTGLASIGAGMFLKGALSEAVQFRKSLNLTQAVTGSTNKEMDLMRQKALEWGAQTQFSSKQVASAMAELGKMGNKTNDILSLMPGTMALAASGEIGMAEAANYSMGILNQFSMGLSEAGTVSDILASGASGAATSVTGIAQAMNNTGLQASMAGLSIKNTTIALMAMAAKNIEGAEAGTLFKNAMKTLLKMTNKTRSGFSKMGIDIDNFRNSTTGQITDFWGLIEAMKATGEQGGKIMADTFDIRALQAFSAITATSSDKLKKFKEVVNNSAGSSKKMSQTLKKGLEPLIQFESVMQNLKVIMGSFITEALIPVLTKFNKWMGNMQKNHPEFLKTITYTLMLITALGAVLIPLGLIISSLGSLIGVFKAAVGITKIFGIAQAVLAGIMGTAGTSIALTESATAAYIIGTKIAAASQWLWNAAVTAFPVIAIIMGIAAIVAGIVWMVRNWDIVKAKMIEWGMVALGFIQKVWTKLSELLDNPFFVAAGVIFAPWLTYPALILKHWEPIKDFFVGLWEKLQPIIQGTGNFFGKIGGFFSGDKSGSTNPYLSSPEPMPSPGMPSGASAKADASVSVYSKGDVEVTPFEETGDLGYNLKETDRR